MNPIPGATSETPTRPPLAYSLMELAEFERFFEGEHEGQVRRAFLLTGSVVVAHDAVQDSFLEVFQRWRELEHPGSYLNRCVLHRCRRLGQGRPKELSLELVADMPEVVGQRSLDLATALAELSFTQRAAIVLRYYGGFSEADIAVALDCRRGSVGPAIHRGLKALKTALTDTEVDT